MQRLYEAMFIVDSNKARENYETLEAACHQCITRHNGEIVHSIKWDDRRLAYLIEKARRGTYILVHFHSEGEAIAKIERQAQINEDVLRVLIIVDEDGIETTTGSARERAEAATKSATKGATKGGEDE